MPPLDASKRRRRRGIILTPTGLQKLLDAKSDAEFEENQGNRYTLEALSERTGLAVDTLTKVFACESKVDKQTLKILYRSFGLTLKDEDFLYPEDTAVEPVRAAASEPTILPSEPELPEGQVPLGSIFYIERPPIESESFKAVLQPGSLIRIKGARRTGKTSLMERILNHAAQNQYKTVSLSFQLADREVFQDLNRLLRWLCASVGLGLVLPNRLGDYWDDLFGSKISCKMYFEQYLLPTPQQPVVLGLDNVDRLFEYPELAGEFFSLLRTWHEEGKNREIWKKLRLVVVHSTEVYIPLEANKSPFNVGLPIELNPLTPEQVEILAERYELNWSPDQTEQLMNLVGGQPYLIKKGLYHLWRKDVTFEELLKTATQPDSIYGDHLQWQQLHLQRHPDLAATFEQVLQGTITTPLDVVSASQLQSLGLITLQDLLPWPSCRLYKEFFTPSSELSGEQ
jgi:hypothetical protein